MPGVLRDILLDAGHDTTDVLRKVLMKTNCFSSTQVFETVEQLIEGHYAEGNVPSDDGFLPFFWYSASPLGAAMYRAEPNLVKYLLSKGADANVQFRDCPIVELAEIHAGQTGDFQCLEILKQHLTRNNINTELYSTPFSRSSASPTT